MGYYVGTNQNPDFKAEGAGEDGDAVEAKADDGAGGEEGEGEEGEGVPKPEKVSVL